LSHSKTPARILLHPTDELLVAASEAFPQISAKSLIRKQLSRDLFANRAKVLKKVEIRFADREHH
jgi:hypothetical protein